MPKTRTYGDDWDEYVDNWRSYAEREPDTGRERTVVYPGDEWGNKDEWSDNANRRLLPHLPADGSGVAVEIGSGAGKYTEALYDHVSRIACFDVSRKFMQVAEERIARAKGPSDKARFELLELKSCFEMRDRVTALGLAGNVDLVFSIDSMQHVELHTLTAYFLNAGLILKTGGHLVMTVASCGGPKGFSRLMDEIAWVYGNERPSHQFYFLSKEIVRCTLEGLGFEVVELTEDRDILFVAKKGAESAARFEQAEKKLHPLWLQVMEYESQKAG